MNRFSAHIGLLTLILNALYAVCDESGASIRTKPFNAGEDAETLYQAMKGWGTNEGKLIGILAGRTNAQRQEIAQAFGTRNEKNLAEYVRSETSGTFRDILLNLLKPLPVFLAEEIHWSLGESKDFTFMSIICTCSPQMLNDIKMVYVNVNKMTLAEAIENKVNHVPSRLFLLRIIAGLELPYRPVSSGYDENKGSNQMKFIPDKKDFCKLDENGKLFTFLSTESLSQIQGVAMTYEKKHDKKHSIVNRLTEFCVDDDLRRVYIITVNYASSSSEYFAKELQETVNGLGTKERALSRIVVWRSEIDLIDIEKAFIKLYGGTLLKSVEGDTSNDYERTLVQIIKGNA